MIINPTLDLDIDTTPEHKELILRPYQQRALEFHQRTHRSFNTFQPGLGKTEVAIAMGKSHQNLVICPSFLTDMWFDRILQYKPNARIVLASGTRKARQRALKLNADWYICNYEMMHTRPPRKERMHKDGTPILALPPYEFPMSKIDQVFFDEAHHLKNRDSKHAQASKDLIRDINLSVTMLTATPIKRDPDDLYMPFSMLYPHEGYHHVNPRLMFNSYYEFIKAYCYMLPSPYGSHTAITSGIKTPIQWLMDECAFFTSYEEAGVYRPETGDPTIIRVPLGQKHKQAYDMIASSASYGGITFTSAMAVMHALRAVTCCPNKIAAAASIADQFDTVVFYTNYIPTAKLLKQELEAHLQKQELKANANYGFIRSKNTTKAPPTTTVPIITGEVPKDERWRIIKSRPPYLICTLGTGSEGIDDLTYIQAVVFLEETYTPLEIEQAIGRVRRAGSKQEKINIYFIHARGTLDEIIHAVQDRRGVTAEQIVRKALEKYKRNYKVQDEENKLQVANL